MLLFLASHEFKIHRSEILSALSFLPYVYYVEVNLIYNTQQKESQCGLWSYNDDGQPKCGFMKEGRLMYL